MKKYIIIILFILITIRVFSQHANFRIYSIEQGLPQSTVYCVFQDSRGYLWIGTDGAGAAYFDGKRFITYSKRQGLCGNIVRSIIEDIRGNIWFATDAGISVYNGHTFFTIDKNFNLPEFPVLKLFKDSKNNIWAGTANGGLCKIKYFKNDSVTIITYNKKDARIQSNFIFDIEEDINGRLWLGLFGGINILTFKGDSIQKIEKLDADYNEIPSNFILDIEWDKEGNAWCATRGAGAFVIFKPHKYGFKKIESFNAESGLNDDIVWAIKTDRNGEIWFGTDKAGIQRMNLGNTTQYTDANGLPVNQIVSITQDNQGNMWFGTFEGGLVQFLGDGISYFTEKEGLPNKNVLAVANDKNNNLWIATRGGGISKLNMVNGKPVFRYYTTKNGLPSMIINSLSASYDGSLWFSYSEGFGQLKNNTIIYYTSKDIPFFDENPISSIFVDAKGNIWVGSQDGICKFDGRGFLTYEDEEGKYNNITGITEDKNGNIWFCLVGGVAKYFNGKLVYYDEVEGLNDKISQAITTDHLGNVWIGTAGGGLFKYDASSTSKKPISHIANDSLLSSNNIYALIFENENTLLVGTDKGFDKVFFNSEQKIVKVRKYDKTDGYPGMQSNFNAVVKDINGAIWLGTLNGLIKYDGKKDIQNPMPPIIHLTSIYLRNEPYDWSQKTTMLTPWFRIPENLKLSHKENFLTFVLSAISLSNPEKVSYKYMLEGLDETWTEQTENTVIYRGLNPGVYTFKILAKNENGIWNESPYTFSFTIIPPLWQRWWFQLIMGILIIIVIYIIMKLREQKLQHDKRVLEEKVRQRTAEIARQKEEIERQHDLIAEQNKEITDSIHYAKRIQQAILPRDEYMKEKIPEYFILFKPRDIVSGDFYWMSEKNNKIIITAADCTGHGVPGAFMSMLGMGFLNQIVNEKGITEPDEILNTLRENIIHALQQKGIVGEAKDGMDASLCTIDLEKRIVKWAGANNPVYIIQGNELFETKADAMPVAIHEVMNPFTKYEFKLNKGDSVYMFSDGFADQFGGPKGKKFKYKPFKEILLKYSDKPFVELKEILDKTIEDWKAYTDENGNTYQQIDDIVVIGVRL